MRVEHSPPKLRILHLEDDQNDRELIAASISRSHPEASTAYATTEAGFKNALKDCACDLILADYRLPGFDGSTALRLSRKLCPDVPFVFVTGTIGEEQAVESLKAGATDCVLKDSLARLPRAIERALREAQQVKERKQAEAKLRASEERFRQLTESINEVFWLTDIKKERILYVSPAYERIWGCTCESLYAQPRSWLDAIHPEDRERILDAAKSRQANGTYDEEYRIVRPDGQVRWISDRAFPIFDASGAPYRVAGVASDITERKKLESQILRSQRMESIGTLASGIAHDLNNALAPIVMATEILRSETMNSETQTMLDLVFTSAQRSAEMVKQLLTFSCGIDGKRLAVPVAKLVREIEGILRQTFPKNIRLRTAASKPLAPILGDATQIHQVLLNLCVNARDAMQHGGTLTLRASNFTVDEHFAGMSVEAKPGKYVLLAVSDTGTGIPPDVRQRIFEPFFTTKPVDKGTGLGLATVQGIVKSHGGFITVYSEVGRGSEFRVYLPAHDAFPESMECATTELPPGKGELILVVDDEEAIRVLTRKTLESFNYRVVTAANGAEAVAICAREGEKVSLMLTDMAMPIMDGNALIAATQTLAPHLKVIAASGRNESFQPGQMSPQRAIAFIHKPFTAHRLLTAIREVLDESTL